MPCNMDFSGCKVINKMECILKRAIGMASHDYVNDYSTFPMKNGLSSLELQGSKFLQWNCLKYKKNMAPAYLGDLVQGTNMPYNIRSKHSLNFAVPTVKAANFSLHSFRYFAVKMWNSLPVACKSSLIGEVLEVLFL